MWALPDGNIIMTGEGHTDWLSGCCFHPSGTQLVTSSGDTTVQIWDFSKRRCILTLEGHARTVWDCSWHSCGDFVASASMDNTSKIRDVNSERCRYTMCGHKDSVNSIEFLPFSNTVLTSSADKTLSLWDARMGLCVYTFYGHLHSCNHATFNMEDVLLSPTSSGTPCCLTGKRCSEQNEKEGCLLHSQTVMLLRRGDNPEGDTIASCDSSGVMKVWDIRKSVPILSVDAGPHSANQVVFDCSGCIVALASSDGSVKVLQLEFGQLSSLRGHGGEVHSIIFDHKAEQLLSGGADGTVCLWT